jgi:hypothetical protein
VKSSDSGQRGKAEVLGCVWSNLYQTLSHSLPQNTARRAANVFLACLLEETIRGARLPALEDFNSINSILGSSIELSSELWEAFTPTLCQLTAPLGDVQFEHWTLDSWIEAFQASDPSRKSLGAFATPTVFANALAEATLSFDDGAFPKSIIDPAAGTGALLLAAHRRLTKNGVSCEDASLRLHGIEFDVASRELCVLLIWVSGGGGSPLLTAVADHIECADALNVRWNERGTYDALLMNPPWESLRHERSEPAMARARENCLRRLVSPEVVNPNLPPLFSAQGRGDRNLAKMFIELAPHIVRKGGRIGAVLPAAFGSDDGMAELRSLLFEHVALDRWTTFENTKRHFNIDSRYKFGLLSGTRSNEGTESLEVRAFCSEPKEINERHIPLERTHIFHIGGPDRMIPEFVSCSERDAVARALSNGVPFFEHGALGTVVYRREVDLTLGRKRDLFWPVTASPPRRSDELQIEDARPIVPVLEGRMVGQYDCFQKSWIEGHGRRAVWRSNGDLPVDQCRPQYVTYLRPTHPHRVAICDVTSATNARTVHATLVPEGWVCGNTAPVLEFEDEEASFAGLAILNSMAFDWVARRIVGGLHLNRFYLARMAWPNLTGAQVSELARLARRIAASHARGLPNHPCKSDLQAIIADMVSVERIVLDGYRMSASMRRDVYREERSDRRGFWRYYDTSEIGLCVARQIVGGNVSAHIAAE